MHKNENEKKKNVQINYGLSEISGLREWLFILDYFLNIFQFNNIFILC